MNTHNSGKSGKRGNMKKQLSVALALLSLAFVPVSSQAYTVNLDGTTATSIDDLEVAGLFYNVTFPTTTAEALYGLPPGTTFPFPGVFPCLETGCDDVKLATVNVLVALDDAGATAVGTADPGVRIFYVGHAVNDIESGVWATEGNFINEWVGPGDGNALLGFQVDQVYADFTPAVIPVPAAVWLFGSALALLGWIRRIKMPNLAK